MKEKTLNDGCGKLINILLKGFIPGRIYFCGDKGELCPNCQKYNKKFKMKEKTLKSRKTKVRFFNLPFEAEIEKTLNDLEGVKDCKHTIDDEKTFDSDLLPKTTIPRIKEIPLSDEIFRNYCPSNVIPEYMCKGHEFLHVLSVKKAIKRFNYVLDVIAIKLKSNDEEDWDVALKMVRDLRKDKYKIFGGKLTK